MGCDVLNQILRLGLGKSQSAGGAEQRSRVVAHRLRKCLRVTLPEFREQIGADQAAGVRYEPYSAGECRNLEKSKHSRAGTGDA